MRKTFATVSAHMEEPTTNYCTEIGKNVLLLVKCKLQGDLYERVWTHLLFFDKLLPVIFEDENFHVQIVHQPAVERPDQTSELID